MHIAIAIFNLSIILALTVGLTVFLEKQKKRLNHTGDLQAFFFSFKGTVSHQEYFFLFLIPVTLYFLAISAFMISPTGGFLSFLWLWMAIPVSVKRIKNANRMGKKGIRPTVVFHVIANLLIWFGSGPVAGYIISKDLMLAEVAFLVVMFCFIMGYVIYGLLCILIWLFRRNFIKKATNENGIDVSA